MEHHRAAGLKREGARASGKQFALVFHKAAPPLTIWSAVRMVDIRVGREGGFLRWFTVLALVICRIFLRLGNVDLLALEKDRSTLCDRPKTLQAALSLAFVRT